MEDPVPYGNTPKLPDDDSQLELCSSRRCSRAHSCLRHLLFLAYCENPDRDATVRFTCPGLSLYIPSRTATDPNL